MSPPCFFGAVITALLLSGCAHAASRPAPQPPHFVSVDIFGTDRISVEQSQALAAGPFAPCLASYVAGDYEKYFPCKNAQIAKLQERYHFAYLDLSLIGYFNNGDRPVYGTFDVVEMQDAAERMNFTRRPTKTFSDPDGLIKAWDDYQKLGFDLLARGEIPGRVACPAFHCIFGHQHPALKPYEKLFIDGVSKNKALLMQILDQDKDDNHRAIAAFLLAYETDGDELIRVLSPHLRDEAPLVRNNVTRVFCDLAANHHELTIPVEEVIHVLNFPTTTDRNKASAVLVAITAQPEQLQKYRSALMRRALPIVLKMLRLQQPDNHDMSSAILRNISGQDFGERNYAAWENWFAQQVTGK